ncbi:MAG TPA: DNA methyltransferase, partial [Pirellulales bacterium]|nr:DNA methyltransferase [Pirellulales bacterium]
MPKSAERKRFGVYYTPPAFTEFLVRETVSAVIERRLDKLREAHGLESASFDAPFDVAQPSSGALAGPAAYWREALAMLRDVKVCDPACGSGAFLIEAYDTLETYYTRVLDQLPQHDGDEAEEQAGRIPDLILADNLHGCDLSEQAVEITQLALWIRSARRGRTLADLSHNIVCRNSLVTDPAIDPRAIDWQATFPRVFTRAGGAGFDCVVGNPPWERLKLQEREFFSASAPEVAGAVSAAKRRQLIAALEHTNPELFALYQLRQGEADRTLAHVRTSGNFPLTAKGDVNTYMLFAELARTIVAPTGRVGLLLPSGIATDHTTRDFFNALTSSDMLAILHDFENRKKVFPDVDGRFKFCTLVFDGTAMCNKSADFAFFLHSMDDLADKDRHIRLSEADIALFNPNTRTCPIFRTRRDAQLTKAIYRRVPILVDESRREGGNPWGIRFLTMFHQTNDAELFQSPDELKEQGCHLDGNRWVKGKQSFVPLYEAKMVQAFDHRAASVEVIDANWVRQGQTIPTSLVSHQNPEFVVQPRWWVDEAEVDRVLAGAR